MVGQGGGGGGPWHRLTAGARIMRRIRAGRPARGGTRATRVKSVANASKKELNACIADPKAVSRLLGHSASDAVILAKAYELARKKDEPIEDADSLYGWLYWCEANGMKKDAAVLSAMAAAIIDLPESAPKGKAAASPKAQPVGFRPKEHAEFTFFATPEFKRACECEHDDVGLFCDAGETLLLQQLERTKKGARIRIRIAEGTCEIAAKQWHELGPDELPAKGRRGAAGSVFDIARIRDEYVG